MRIDFAIQVTISALRSQSSMISVDKLGYHQMPTFMPPPLYYQVKLKHITIPIAAILPFFDQFCSNMQ